MRCPDCMLVEEDLKVLFDHMVEDHFWKPDTATEFIEWYQRDTKSV